MYKTLLRTLSALSIVTITASAGFAEHPEHTLDLPCTDSANAHTENCRAKAGIKPVTTDVWKDSFESDSVPPTIGPNPTSRSDQFISPEASIDHYTNKERVNLKFDINNDGTNTIVGTSIFYMVNNGNVRNFYAGIQAGADLGAPLVEAFPEAVWKTRFKAVGSYNLGVDFQVNEIFDLTVKFISNSADPEAMGEISGYIQHTGYYGFKIDAQFNNAGVITGTDGITYGRFQNAQAEPTNTIVGNLTGIIGERGALGAFHSDGNSNSRILGFAGGFRTDGYSEDELVTLRKCVLDPFHAQCSEDKFDALKDARIELCIDGNNASEAARLAKPHECHNAVVAEGCILNPFQATCTGDTSDFNKHSAAARANRATFCDSSANAKDAFCKVGTIVTDVCVDDPFHAICGDDFKPQRKAIVKTCLVAGNCEGKILKRPNAAVWENSFKTEENPEGLADGADVISSESQFLKGTTTGLNIGRGRTSTVKTLNLSKAKFNIDGSSVTLGGDAEDGVAFLGRFVVLRPKSGGTTTKTYNHSAIFSGTDLGAPVTDEEGTASWVGSFQDKSSSAQDFVLEVNFDNQSIEAFVADYGPYSIGSHIKGGYDDSGVISGTVTRSKFTDNNRNKLTYRNETILTGLIGKEGAVGAFVGSSRYVGNVGGFVARPAEYVTGAVDYLNGICDADDGNPFHQYCYLRQDAQKAVIDNCITGKDVLNDENCLNAREHHSCLLHPFNEECKRTLTYHNETLNKPYYKIVRENRVAFCNVLANATNNLCTGAERRALCSYDPFHTLCTNAIYDNARKAVCRSDLVSERCANYQPSGNVTTASWLSSLYKDNGFVPQTEPDTLRPRSQFLQGTADGLDNGDVEIYTNSRGLTYSYSLNLNTATLDGLELGGDAADGVAFFWDTSSRRYVGIFSGTDLGAPLVRPTEEADMMMTWYGQFQWDDLFSGDFTLDIKFNTESTGTVKAFVHRGFSIHYYLLDGTFDANGVISGTVGHGGFPNHDRIASRIYSTSVLTGLIGAEGAVGVFQGFYSSGGFVASSKKNPFDPNVKASDWVRSFGNAPKLPNSVLHTEPRQTRFLQGQGTGLVIYGRAVRPPNPLTLADVNIDGEVADGVDYASQGRRYHYSGILSGTNLGAALPTVPAGAGGAITAIWDGKLGLVANAVEIPKRDIKLTVDFTNTNITIADTRTDDNKHFVNFNGLGWDENGVITGNITYDATPTLQTNGSYAASDGSKSEGIVRGLIGRDGAVGAFRSYHGVDDTGTNTAYAGGFVAVPVVDHLNWVNSFSNPSDVSVGVGGFQGQQTRFVQGTGTSLNKGHLGNSVIRTLKLADGDLGGEAADGAVYASGTWNVLNDENGTDLTPRHYAGLLSGISLGLPLPRVPAGADGNPVIAIWDGKLGLIADGDSDIPKRDIDLMVDFTNNKISHSSAVDGAHFVDLNANWKSGVVYNGVLKGTITYNPGAALDNLAVNSADSAGTVTGLIGQQGAVGAFRSNHVDNPTATHTSYAGGFVAVPVANYQIWKHSFGNPTSLLAEVPWYADGQPQTEFLQGGETYLDPGFINNPVPRSLDFANSGLGGEATDGVAYLSGTWRVEENDVPRHFAGILSGTNMGALLNASVAATWNGKLGLIADGNGDIPKRDITLNIDFANRGIEIADTRAPSRHFVAFNGLSFDEAGVISGTMTYNPGAASVSATNSAGKVTGLIGQRGAVGAFISNPDNPSSKAAYAGGFVAVPPSE